ncbi:integral membrane protein [Legionella geestiana]|uniref:Integral membrane protein n=1 Tax=Legionella geestiana TaxID=45065 RepID=A0A0W0TTL8_9GAMM|nr:DMT family transporter [Legionella geestiana]KTC98860.1 integral membrane protein [Legionella geestiana]STX54778.1 permease, DMT superfamily [Legionella geestiana]
MGNITPRQKGILYATLSGVFFGLLGFYGVRVMQTGMSVFTMLFWRYLVASMCMMLVCMLSRDTSRAPPMELAKVFLWGVLFYSGSSIFYFLASQTLGTGLSMALLYTYPAMVMLAGLLFQGRIPGLYSLLALLVMMPGLWALTLGGSFHITALGMVWGLLSALTYSLYVLISKDSPVNPMLSTLMVSLGCLVTCLGGALVEGSFSMPQTAACWEYILILAIVCTSLPIVLLLKGLELLSPLEVSILSVLEPVFILFFGITLLHETLSLAQALGALLLIGGSLLSLREPMDVNAERTDCQYTPR